MRAFGELTLQAMGSSWDWRQGRRTGGQKTDFKGVFFLAWVGLPFPCAQISISCANCEPVETLIKEAELIRDASKETQFQKQKLQAKKPA